MKTPGFWNDTSWRSTLLIPFSVIYDMASTLYRANIRPLQLPIPVICIGNLTAGGAGKTPVALHIGQMVGRKNIKAIFLSRGYGGKLEGPVLVDPQKHTANEVGDEPLLLAEVLPTIIAKNRLEGARMALKLGAQAIIMDDGFQNPFIHKSLSIVVIDGKTGFGNGRLLPAGPLRERPQIALRRAHMVVLLNRTTRIPPLPSDKPVFIATTITRDASLYKGKKMMAFCGIAYPEKFFEMLGRLNANIVGTTAFPDHHPYTEQEINKLIVQASAQKAVLVTTTKDAVRIPARLRDCVATVEIAVDFDMEPVVDTILDYILGLNEDA
jgi:tetraacyldisaccharide 4'-kinase